MNTFFTYALVLFAYTIASGYCAPNYGVNAGYGPAVQQVALSSVPNIEQYLNGASSYNAPAPAYSSPSYAPAPSYGPAPSYAPATAVVPQSAPSYSSAAASNSVPAASYNAAPAYSAPSAPAYSAPSYTIQPAYAQTIYPGQQNYKAYASPTEYNTVSLPIIASRPVAKLYVPNNAYGSAQSY